MTTRRGGHAAWVCCRGDSRRAVQSLQQLPHCSSLPNATLQTQRGICYNSVQLVPSFLARTSSPASQQHHTHTLASSSYLAPLRVAAAPAPATPPPRCLLAATALQAPTSAQISSAARSYLHSTTHRRRTSASEPSSYPCIRHVLLSRSHRRVPTDPQRLLDRSALIHSADAH